MGRGGRASARGPRLQRSHLPAPGPAPGLSTSAHSLPAEPCTPLRVSSAAPSPARDTDALGALSPRGATRSPSLSRLLRRQVGEALRVPRPRPGGPTVVPSRLKDEWRGHQGRGARPCSLGRRTGPRNRVSSGTSLSPVQRSTPEPRPYPETPLLLPRPQILSPPRALCLGFRALLALCRVGALCPVGPPGPQQALPTGVQVLSPLSSLCPQHERCVRHRWGRRTACLLALGSLGPTLRVGWGFPRPWLLPGSCPASSVT